MRSTSFGLINSRIFMSLAAAISLAFFVILVFSFTSNFVPKVYAADDAVSGLKQTANKAYADTTEENKVDNSIIQDIPSAIGKIVGALLSFIGVIFLILMIYGGFTWMLARGNEQDVTKAKELIFAAVIGLIIVLSAYAITSYIGLKLI